MDIDLSTLRMIERDKDIPLDYLLTTLEDALLNAYDKTEAPVNGAKVQLDRKTGNVAVMLPEKDEEGQVVGWYDGTPEDFGRVAASTARQVIFQRLREAEDEQKYGHFAAVEGDVITGVVQQSYRDTRTVRVDLGSLEGIMPPAEQVPGEKYSHGRRIRVYVVAVRKEARGPQVIVSRTHPNLVRKLFLLWRYLRSSRGSSRSRRWLVRPVTARRLLSSRIILTFPPRERALVRWDSGYVL
ncbi:transcription termination protein NusA [Cutibacterium acnes JCM 18909]|nr:transcription termination protein NusA [Cutibacterium acnes JCM 18909]